MSIKGVFRVFLDSKQYTNKVCGTAFMVARDNINIEYYYLLTAFHVISEAYVKSQKIILKNFDYDSCFIDATVVWTPSSNEGYEFGGDFAVLKIKVDPNVDFKVYPLKSYVDNKIDLSILGASIYAPAEKHPEFHKVPVLSHSLENIVCDSSENCIESNKSLVMEINFAGNVNAYESFQNESLRKVTPQEVYGGFSGAPILSLDDSTEVCIGVMSNVENDSVASKVYGVVSDTILAKCPIIHELSKSIIIGEKSINGMQNGDLGCQFKFLTDIIFDDPDDFNFEDPNLERNMWDKVSNLFYKGHPMDIIIDFGLNSEQINSISINMQLMLRYFLARLYFKRGKQTDAYKQFTIIKNNERNASLAIWNRINILIESRCLIESTQEYIPQNSIEKMMRIEEKMSHLNTVNDVYRANELASVLGKGLSNIFKQKCDFSNTECKQIQNLFCQHRNLLLNYPEDLKKQDVVNTSISWLINAWSINSSIDISKLLEDVKIGFTQAKNRKNSIFHIQSLLAFSLHEFLTRNFYNGVVILFLVCQLMKRERLDYNHEGISQLFVLLKTFFPNYYWMFNIIFNYTRNDFISNERQIFDKINLYRDSLSDKEIISARLLSKDIMDSKYSNTDKLYLIKLSDILDLL